MITDLAIKGENLYVRKNNRQIIKGCHINVKSGTIYGLLGENGSGKTTLFKMLLGLVHSQNGELELLGKEAKSNRSDLLKQIGTLIEVPTFYEGLSAEKKLKLHATYMGVNVTSEHIKSTIRRVGLSPDNQDKVASYSLGMRQRLALARAIIHQPKLLILDEPINGLDPRGIKRIRDLLIELKEKEGMTIVISSHILSEIESVADDVGIIVNGHIRKEEHLSVIEAENPKGLEDYYFAMTDTGGDYD